MHRSNKRTSIALSDTASTRLATTQVHYEKPVNRAHFEVAITETGYGKFNINILLASGGCLMMVIIETMSMMMIVPAAQCDLELSLATKALLNAISFFGVVASSHLWGFIADTRGRRNVLIISMLTSFVTSLASSLVPWAWLFILIRFINGFFVGGASAVVYAYVGEFHNNVYRPKVVSWIATFVAFGNMVIPGLAWAILPLAFSFDIDDLDFSFRPWRVLVVCYGAPSLIFALWLLNLPESPKYLMSQGRFDEALQILQYMYAKNTGNDPDEFPITECIWDEESEVDDERDSGLFARMWSQTVPLFRRKYLLKTLMVCLLQFGVFASSTGLIMWYPEIINRMSTFSRSVPNAEVSLCDAIEYFNNKTQAKVELTNDDDDIVCYDHVQTDAFLISLLIGSTSAVIYIVFGIIINAVGPKRLLIVYITLTTACGIIAQNIAGQVAIEGLIGIFLCSATCVGVINVIVVDLFPTNLRGMVLAISLMAGRLGAFAGSNAAGPLVFYLCPYAFYTYGIDHLILVITVILLPSPKTTKVLVNPNA